MLDQGWKQPSPDVTPGVWDHPSGTRLHLGGCLRLLDGVFIEPFRWPESMSADHCIRIMGGNRKRGLMLWAQRRVLHDSNKEAGVEP